MWSTWREGVSRDKALRLQGHVRPSLFLFSFSLLIDHDVALDYFPSTMPAMFVATCHDIVD